MSTPPGHNTPAANRFEALDGWRGVCACLVVLFHFHGYSPIYFSPLVRNSYLFVDFFFVLSGFVIAWNYAAKLGTWPQVRRFLVLRVGRVYPLHVFMLLCFLALETARMVGGRGQSNSWPTFTGETEPFAVLTNLFLVQSLHLHDTLTWNGPAWSISTEVWTYVLFALLCVTVGVRGWMLAVAAIVPPVALLYLSNTGMDVTFDWGLLRCILGFAMGVACYLVQRRRAPATTVPSGADTALATALELLAVVAVVQFVSFAGKSSWSLLAPFVFALAVLIFASERGWVSRVFRTAPLRWLGMLSYSIYMTHYFIVLLMPKVIKGVFHVDLWTRMPTAGGELVEAYGRNNLEGTLFFGVVLVITVAFSALTYRWIETPGRDWSRRFAGRPNSLKGPYGAVPSGAVADGKSISTSTARRA